MPATCQRRMVFFALLVSFGSLFPIGSFAQEPCNYDYRCEMPRENHKNCPTDCLSGIADGICDFKLDLLCDPDCKGSEADCSGIIGDKAIMEKVSSAYKWEIKSLTLLLASADEKYLQDNIGGQIHQREERLKHIASIPLLKAEQGRKEGKPVVALFFAGLFFAAVFFLVKSYMDKKTYKKTDKEMPIPKNASLLKFPERVGFGKDKNL